MFVQLQLLFLSLQLWRTIPRPWKQYYLNNLLFCGTAQLTKYMLIREVVECAAFGSSIKRQQQQASSLLQSHVLLTNQLTLDKHLVQTQFHHIFYRSETRWDWLQKHKQYKSVFKLYITCLLWVQHFLNLHFMKNQKYLQFL